MKKISVKHSTQQHDIFVDVAKDLVKIDNTELSISYNDTSKSFVINGFEIMPEDIVKLSSSLYRIHVGTYSLDIELHDTLLENLVAKSGGGGLVDSPMSGVITKVLVKPGDRVDEETVLLVLSAMKMENELTAPGSGVVQEVKVSEHDSVQSGDRLIEIKLDEE